MTADSKNNFYCVSLFIRCLRDDVLQPDNLWEESFVLIEAISPDAAAETASEIGRSRNISYLNSAGEKLSWQFFKVGQIFELDGREFVSGAEVFSRHLRHSEAISLMTPFDDSALS
jgi:Domain of unknown function (DUF4288)